MKEPVSLACIIDDDECYVFALKRMLTLFKLAESTINFPNGEDAIDFLTIVKDYPAQIPDVIFLDINMPLMNGWQFLESFAKLQEQLSKPISIYMISSSIDIRDIHRVKTYTTVSDYLTKPVSKDDLFRVLEEVQSKKEQVNKLI